MSRTRSFLQLKAAERVPAPLLDAAGRAVLKGVDQAVERRWQRALARAEAAQGDTVDDRVRSVAKSFHREMVSLGVATGATAATPGLGTAGAASLLVADMTWFAFRSADLIMTVAAVHGRVESTVEERRAWVLLVLALGEGTADEVDDLLSNINPLVVAGSDQVGALVAGVVGGDAATVDGLRRLNTNLAARVLTRYGSRRGMVTVGKLLPFGVGALVGGSANWALIRSISKRADRLFSGRDRPAGGRLRQAPMPARSAGRAGTGGRPGG